MLLTVFVFAANVTVAGREFGGEELFVGGVDDVVDDDDDKFKLPINGDGCWIANCR